MKKKKHIHTYDNHGNMTCCSLEEKIDKKTDPQLLSKKDENHKEDKHDHDHGSNYWPVLISFALLVLGLILEYLVNAPFFKDYVKIAWYVAAYLPVGLPVLKEAIIAIKKGEIFTEFFLMTIATIGAMAIGEYPEGVAVMLFYTVGELFQAAAVKKAKNNVKALLDVRAKIASVWRNDSFSEVQPEQVQIGETIQVKVGEKVPLDGILLSEKASLNTAALTGESKPQTIRTDEKIMAGSINLEGVIELKVEKLFHDSSIARILELVQNATSKKSKTELLIRRLAKIYTPIVVYLAIAICFIPYFFVAEYVFSDWLYRALIFLVISCPCALVISIPLGYFGGLGAASKNGILFKGATFLDQITKVNTLVMDKTGTLTKGVFKIKEIKVLNSLSEVDFMKALMAIESKSTHPIAKAILEYDNNIEIEEPSNVEEIAGKGLKGQIGTYHLLAGNKKLMDEFKIEVPSDVSEIIESIVLVAMNQEFAGYVIIADELKEGANQTINRLKSIGVNQLVMLSGDKDSITQKVATELNINQAKGGLLPEDKLKEVENIQQDKSRVVAFVGDGINDAPVLAVSEIGIAMGGLGSDVAIETADIVIQTDQISKIVTAINIGKSTQKIIWQNIGLAFGVKILVLILGAFGLATMWEAVFADVGVALLAILNAVRLQRMEWKWEHFTNDL
ncbi:MAG: heavy metal translocating P-type ATPase [Chitinophagales bacterium]